MEGWLANFCTSEKLLGPVHQTIAFSLYSLGNEMSQVSGWLPATRGKNIVTGTVPFVPFFKERPLVPVVVNQRAERFACQKAERKGPSLSYRKERPHVPV